MAAIRWFRPAASQIVSCELYCDCELYLVGQITLHYEQLVQNSLTVDSQPRGSEIPPGGLPCSHKKSN